MNALLRKLSGLGFEEDPPALDMVDVFRDQMREGQWRKDTMELERPTLTSGATDYIVKNHGELAFNKATHRNLGAIDGISRTASRQPWAIGYMQPPPDWGHFALKAPPGQYQFYNQIEGVGPWGGSVGYRGGSSEPTIDSVADDKYTASMLETADILRRQGDVSAAALANQKAKVAQLYGAGVGNRVGPR